MHGPLAPVKAAVGKDSEGLLELAGWKPSSSFSQRPSESKAEIDRTPSTPPQASAGVCTGTHTPLAMGLCTHAQ